MDNNGEREKAHLIGVDTPASPTAWVAVSYQHCPAWWVQQLAQTRISFSRPRALPRSRSPPHRWPRPRPPAPQTRPGQPCTRPRAMPRSPLSPARLRNRPPSCSNHSAGIRAPSYSTTSGAGAGPDGTENDCALRAGSSQSHPGRHQLRLQANRDADQRQLFSSSAVSVH